MQKTSLKKNFAFQFVYQLLIMVVPLVLSPYLTRTLQEKALGTYSYVNSIAYFFVIMANLGIAKHGQRVISQSSHDSVQLRRNFWSLFFFHQIISFIALGLYWAFIIVFVKEDQSVYYIQMMYVCSAMFDITWLFYGLENFQSVVIKNAVVKITECIAIFLLVKASTDLLKYTLITSVSVLLGQLIMIPQAIGIIKPIRFTINDVKKHLGPLFLFSIAIIASTLYTVFDKTLLGLMTAKENVAFYEYSNRIISVPLSITTVIGTVMFPRACKMAAQGDTEGQLRFMNYSFIIIACISFGSIFGLLSVADEFAVAYLGESFKVCGSVMKALSPLIFIIGMGNVVRTQYMIPNGMDKQYTICIILNAVVNLCLSILLIPYIGIYGAVIGTTSAELFGFVFQLLTCRKYINIKDLFYLTIPFVAFGAIMFVVILVMKTLFNTTLIINVMIGAVIYCLQVIVFLLRTNREMVFSLIRINRI
ncbi:TPA: oligosaccharide flippase family protein [Streptococcus suis]